MKLYKQITGIFLLSMLGTVVAELVPFPFPAGVFCMVLLFVLFCTGTLKTTDLRETAEFLSGMMAVLFVPAGVGLIRYFDLLKSTFVPILLICLISTFVTFAATAYTVQAVSRLQETWKKRGAFHE